MASTFRKLRVAWTAGAVLACLLPAISHGSDEVLYVPSKSPAVREKLEWFHDDFWENCGIGTRTDRYPTYDTAKNPEKWAAEIYLAETNGNFVQKIRCFLI